MKKIFLYHLIAFLAGAVGIAGYFVLKTSVLSGAESFAVIALLPVAVVYIIGFGILCLLSCLLGCGIRYFKGL
jgi:hypothetical protein